MHRRTALAGASALLITGIAAGGAAAGPHHDGSATAATPGFTTVETLPQGADIAALPDGGVAIATPGADHVTLRRGNGTSWSTTVIPTTAVGAQVESDHGVLWVLTWGPETVNAKLWRVQGNQVLRFPMPTTPQGTTPPVRRLRARDGVVAVFGDATGKWLHWPISGTSASWLVGSRWRFSYNTTSFQENTGDPDGLRLTAVVSGHPLSSSYWRPTGVELWDPLSEVRPGPPLASYSATAPTVGWAVTSWDWRTLENRTYWKWNVSQDQVTTSTCTHLTGETETPCPAPAWLVGSSALMTDGRTVLGGTSEVPFPGRAAVTSPARPGYAVADTAGTIHPVAGDPGKGVTKIVTAPGGSVWSLTQAGVLQHAVLGDHPTPAPTTTTVPATTTAAGH